MSATQKLGTATRREDSEDVRKKRLLAVAASVAAAVVVWILIDPIGGIDLRSPAFEGNPEGFDIGLFNVAMTAGLASVAAWAALALAERFSNRPRRTWIVMATVGFLFSLSGPFSGTGLDTDQQLLLVLLHLVTAAVLIPLMARTAPPNGKEQ